jgi:antitoxin component YwqK of YwqJK toxin-antitoxin module
MIVRKLLFFIFIGLMSVSFANASADQGGEINKKDSEGRKQGKWVVLGKDRPSAGFPTEGKIEEGPYVDDRKEGTWIKYHNDGVTPKLKGEYHNNRPAGAYTKLYADGVVREVGVFERNKYSGNLKRYHENGKLELDVNYNDEGKEDGTVKYYYPNGQEEFVYEANNGVPKGKAIRYYENGDVKEVIYYASDGSVEKSEQKEMVSPSVKVVDPGASKEMAPKISSPRTKGASFKPNAYNKVYNQNDEIWQDGDFRNGRLWSGKVYEYDSDGILLKVKVFKNGVYHSDGQL